MNSETNVVPMTPGADRALERELKAHIEELPEDAGLLIIWTQDRFEEGVRGFIKAGLGLIKLERVKGAKTFSQIVEENFPGLNLRTAQMYMQVSGAFINHPAFQAFQKERGGYSKALTILQMCSEREIEEADKTGEVRGYTMEKLLLMSSRTMRKALLKAEEAKEKAVMAATEKTGKENLALLERVAELEAALAPPGVRAAYEVVHKAQGKFMQVTQLLGKIPRKLIDQDQGLQNLILAACDGFQRVIGELAEYAMDSLAQFEAKRHPEQFPGAD